MRLSEGYETFVERVTDTTTWLPTLLIRAVLRLLPSAGSFDVTRGGHAVLRCSSPSYFLRLEEASMPHMVPSRPEDWLTHPVWGKGGRREARTLDPRSLGRLDLDSSVLSRDVSRQAGSPNSRFLQSKHTPTRPWILSHPPSASVDKFGFYIMSL